MPVNFQFYTGTILSVGGFLSFMLTGSVSAIRFGVILGVALLASSVSSLKLYKGGQSSPLAIKGQADINSGQLSHNLSQMNKELRILNQQKRKQRTGHDVCTLSDAQDCPNWIDL
ncbi:protein FATTY ACID EXPORT 3, chloroplastic-like isoform X1 [Gossypium australe]|uniref:Protein FATTY ACID EXPORT 3, chloroplastic-like isoform X1 n=1 Tax=Gossypium australe TaxID=47621 RepID=A0A5B6WEW3_9ROSI|nr:protein FATTY ACID EXPORT 3, chloroplastic-like isoform X1 [Gossypium australe]